MKNINMKNRKMSKKENNSKYIFIYKYIKSIL